MRHLGILVFEAFVYAQLMNVLTYQTQTKSIKIDGVKNLFIRSLLDRQQYYDPTGAAARLGICLSMAITFDPLSAIKIDPPTIRFYSLFALIDSFHLLA